MSDFQRFFVLKTVMFTFVLSFLGLPVFSQPNVSIPYGHEMQAAAAAGTMYNRQMTELQNAVGGVVDKSSPVVQTDSKKTKRRKSAKNGKTFIVSLWMV